MAIDLKKALDDKQMVCMHRQEAYISSILLSVAPTTSADLVHPAELFRRQFNIQLICKSCGARLNGAVTQQ